VQQLRTMEIVKREYLQGPSKEGRDRQEAAATLADFAGLEHSELVIRHHSDSLGWREEGCRLGGVAE
jgi:hypothetical protein